MARRTHKIPDLEGLSDLVRLNLDRLEAHAERLDGISVRYAGRLLGLGRLRVRERVMLADVLQARRWTLKRGRRLGRRITVWRPRAANDEELKLAASADSTRKTDTTGKHGKAIVPGLAPGETDP